MAIVHKLTVNEMYFTPLFNLVSCSTQVDFSLEKYLADIMQQTFKKCTNYSSFVVVELLSLIF